MSRESIESFIKRNGLTMDCVRVKHRQDEDAGTPSMWGKDASHYYCTISGRGGQFSVFYSMGSAHKTAPTLADVLDSLASDASSVEGQSFEDWVADMGWSADSIRALVTFETIKRQSIALRRTINSNAAYQELLDDVERL